eukprot:SAG31_NODE_1592_length_7813_cov_28.409386_4_plen_125_part_00
MLQNSGDAMVAIDMPAGPSEQLCIADRTCNIKVNPHRKTSPTLAFRALMALCMQFMVSDLISQAEHGVDSQVVAVILEDGVPSMAIQMPQKSQLNATTCTVGKVSTWKCSKQRSLRSLMRCPGR